MIQTLKVRHNIEVAHRLSLLQGKCEQIHGHSMWVVAEFEGLVDVNGILLSMDFSEVKRHFRSYLDDQYDHHLLLNEDDYLAKEHQREFALRLPGLVTVPGDPTTENIARWIGEWCCGYTVPKQVHRIKVEVWETQTNSATWEVRYAERTTPDRAVLQHTG